jgi:DNA-binding GntR family transcriptional regulator
MPKKQKLKDIVYLKLREQILLGDIPANSSMSEQKIAEDLGTSRTPVREALLMLEADGLISIYPNKGPIVRGISIDDIVWITQIREGLEGVATRVACDRANVETLEEIKNKLLKISDFEDQNQQELSYLYGRELHEEILRCTGNIRMTKIVENLRQQYDRIMKISRSAPMRPKTAWEQHLDIIDTILRKDHDEAENRMRNHIRSVSNDAINILQQSFTYL